MAPEPAAHPGDLEAIAARILGQAVKQAEPAPGGGNNRVYRITAEDGPFALKFYPSQDEDPRDRLGQEFAALAFMAANGIGSVPKPIAHDPALRCGIYEWIDGAPVADPGEDDLRAMVDLAARLSDLGMAPGAGDLVAASAHCFSGAAAIRQLEERLQRLREAGRGKDALNRFLDGNYCPLVQPLTNRAQEIYGQAGLHFDTDLLPEYRTLSPSDFGFHNALRRDDGNNGSIIFLDFEYFGWDDPVKMISDAVWHPGSALNPALGSMFRKDAGKIFEVRDGNGFSARFDALHPLFGMIWCLILLNEFLPERWHRRVAAGNTADAERAQTRQLNAAKKLVQRISEICDD